VLIICCELLGNGSRGTARRAPTHPQIEKKTYSTPYLGVPSIFRNRLSQISPLAFAISCYLRST